jgi:hypothetical protein
MLALLPLFAHHLTELRSAAPAWTFNDYVVETARTPELRKRFSDEGVEIIASSPAQFGAHIKRELAHCESGEGQSHRAAAGVTRCPSRAR